MNITNRVLTLLACSTVSLCTLAAADPAPGGSVLKHIEWKAESLPEDAALRPADGGKSAVLSIAHKAAVPASITLWKTSEPGIQTKCYALRGRIRYQKVEGTSYLEMWSEFPEAPDSPAGKYFSRTLAEMGPLMKISGSSDWRSFMVPFDGTQSKTLPKELTLNLVLAGAGTVDVSDVELVQFANPGAMWASLGVAANASLGRPWWLAPAPILIGSIGVAVVVGVSISLAKRKQAELRRMRAMDAR